MSPIIFNMVVDIRHRATRVSGEDLGPELFGREVKKLAALFYAEDSLTISLQP